MSKHFEHVPCYKIAYCSAIKFVLDATHLSYNLGRNNMEQKPPYPPPPEINVEVSRREKRAILHP